MDDRMDEVYLDFEKYPKTENYELKRSFAYLIDQSMIFLCVIFFAIILTVDLSNYTAWLIILVLAGIFNWLVKSVMEGMRGESIGKGIMGLKVVDAYGGVTVGESLVRNFLEIVPVILPVFDYLIGLAVAKDGRQKLMDTISKTLVVEDVPMIAQERPQFVPRRVATDTAPRDKVMLDYRRLRVGHCPRCDAPYRVLGPGDTSFSGLWNHRCTWCNNLITESYDEK